MHAHHHRRLGQRGRDVVAIAHVGDGASGQGAEGLLQRQQVGHGLARVLFVGEGVDHVQARRGRGKLFEHLLREGANDDGIHPAFEVARDVGRRLASAERYVGGDQNGIRTQLPHCDLEGHARAQRRLVEQQRDLAPGKRRLGAASAGGAGLLHPRGLRQARRQLRGGQIGQRQKRARHRRRRSTGTGWARGLQWLHPRARSRRGRSTHVRYSPLIRTYSALRSQVHATAWPSPPVPRSTWTSSSDCRRYVAAAGA